MADQNRVIEVSYPRGSVRCLLGKMRRLSTLDNQMVVEIGDEENSRHRERTEHADHVQANEAFANEDKAQHDQAATAAVEDGVKAGNVRRHERRQRWLEQGCHLFAQLSEIAFVKLLIEIA